MGKQEDPNIKYVDGCPGWMMTMGDCMSLLLCFFVLLLTFSTKNREKLMDVIGSIQGALSIMEPPDFRRDKFWYKDDQKQETQEGNIQKGTEKKVEISRKQMTVANLNSMDVVNRYNAFKNRILRLGFKNIITATQLEQGIAVRIDTNAMFKDKSAIIKPSARQFLESFVNLISGFEGSDFEMHKIANEVRITSNFIPRRGAWNLSQKRLATLMIFFKKVYKIPLWRFSIADKVITDANEKEVFEFLLCEKLGTSEVGIDELIKMSSSEQGSDI